MAGLIAVAVVAGGAWPPAAAHAESPRVNYMLECQGCHLADGSGSPGAVPDLRASLPALLRVPGGRSYLVQVPGSATSPLSDADLAAVLNWMTATFAATERVEPFTAAEVAAHRRSPLVEVEARRAELLGASGRAAGGGPGVY